MHEILDDFTLEEMLDKKSLSEIYSKYNYMPLLNADRFLSEKRGNSESGRNCPAQVPVENNESG
jgi:hypothetical protein